MSDPAPVVQPAPVPAPDPVLAVHTHDEPTPAQSNYTWQYWLNLILVVLTVATVIANTFVTFGNAAFLGLTDIQWHWALLVSAILTALNTAFNHTPQVTAPPTKANIAKVQ